MPLPSGLSFFVSLSLVLGACATAPKQPVKEPQPVVASPRPVGVIEPPESPGKPRSGLYTPREALIDVLAGRWVYLGTGRWPGNNRTHACAYHNGQVFIVDVYCTVTEMQAFRVEVLSPQRGRLRIYAEASGPVSRRARSEFFTFMIESEPRPDASGSITPLSLSMPLPELQHYEAQRYDAFLPACYGGTQHGKVQGGCLGELAPRSAAFKQELAGFSQDPGPAFYQLVKILRGLALKYGRDPG